MSACPQANENRLVPIVQPHADGAVVAVKVVPGASRDRIVGPLGERLKVAVRQPPEKGAANRAVGAMLAEALAVKVADVELVRGAGRPRKAFLVRGLGPAAVRRRLGLI